MFRSVIIIAAGLCLAAPARGQNCCAPAVPQQGVMGETVALPQTLEVGFHYQVMRSEGMYQGTDKVNDPGLTRAIWKRATLSLSYGLLDRLAVTAIVPYTWKNKTRYIEATDEWLEATSDGFGDLTCLFRFSLLPRSFVNFREVSIGAGLKIPTGSTDRRNYGFLLPEELQPGTGSWDVSGMASFYQGYETIDFFASVTYVMTGNHEGYEFGDEFSYMASSNLHLHERMDLSLGLSGTVKAKDIKDGEQVCSTGRHQLLLTPGVQAVAIPDLLRVQAFFELPVYQHFNGTQLGSDYNLRLSASLLILLASSEEE